jgi:uncharacterized protein (DUF2062 family)/SAM-dependent methyltransferase
MKFQSPAPDNRSPAKAPAPFSAWREEVKRAWTELRGPGTTPARAAVSVAVGLFIGSLPVFGFHTPLVVVLCLWFQLDAAISWVAANVSNPFFAPALLTAEAAVGAWIRHGTPLSVERKALHAGHVADVVGSLVLGAPVVGFALAMVGAAITYGVVALGPKAGTRPPYRLPESAPVWVKTVERVASRFASPTSAIARERTRFHYLRAKLLGDPAAKAIVDIADGAANAFGAVLDLGTGRGPIPLLLLEMGLASSAHGIDWDAHKIARATRAAAVEDAGAGIRPLAAVFSQGDLRTAAFEPADTVLLVDALHYVRLAEQDAILDRAAAAVRPGGRILLRDADTRRGWRSWMTLAEERFFTWIRFNRGERVCFRPARDIVGRLEAAGIRCTVRPAWGKTPFSNVLVVGERDGRDARDASEARARA